MATAAPPPYRHARIVFVTISAVAFAAGIIVGRAVMLPFLLAVVVAYVLFPAVTWFERRRMPRWVAILLVYAIAMGAVTGFGLAVVPRLFEETKSLSAALPGLTERIRDDWLPRVDDTLQKWAGVEKPAANGDAAQRSDAPPDPGAPEHPELPPPDKDPAPIVITPRGDGSYEIELRDELEVRPKRDGSYVLQQRTQRDKPVFSSERALRDAFDKAIAYAQTNSLELLQLGRKVVAGVSRGVFYFFLTLMLAGYIMFTYENIHKFVRDMWPEYRREAFDRFLHRLDRGLAGVVRGQLLICLVNGILSAIGFWIFDLKYWPILALIAAMMSIIPIFGSILSSIPAVAIGLTQSFGTAIGVLVWIVAIHQLEANFLNPKIIGDQAKIHPVLVVFSLLLGEHFFQITGALLAVPCLAVVQSIFMHFRESILGLPASSLNPAGVGAEPLVATGTIATGQAASDDATASGRAADRPKPARDESILTTMESPTDDS